MTSNTTAILNSTIPCLCYYWGEGRQQEEELVTFLAVLNNFPVEAKLRKKFILGIERKSSKKLKLC